MVTSYQADLKRQQSQKRTLGIAAGAFAAALALLVGLIIPRPASPTQLALPSQVTPASCAQVAKAAHVYSKSMTVARIGQYYAAWANRFAAHVGVKTILTRTDLFHAGIAVSVCLR